MWVKLIPYAAGLILLCTFIAVIHHRGVLIGRAQIQAKFDSFLAAQAILVAKDQKEADDKLAAAETRNAQALKDYQRQLGNSHAYADLLAGRLRDYLQGASAGTVPEGGDQPGAASEPKTPSSTGIGERIGDAIAECRNNEQQLQSLLDELTPQL